MEYSSEFKTNHQTAYLAEEFERLEKERAESTEAAGDDAVLLEIFPFAGQGALDAVAEEAPQPFGAGEPRTGQDPLQLSVDEFRRWDGHGEQRIIQTICGRTRRAARPSPASRRARNLKHPP